MQIALISCVKSKKQIPCKTKDMYTSTLFHFAYKYAQHRKVDKIFILSAKYGLLDENQLIEPYEMTLNTMKNSAILAWSNNVIKQLEKLTNLSDDNFIILAGDRYRKYLLPYMNNYEIPMEGLSFGRQLSWLKNQLS